jgi:hypothetical protein
MYAIVKQSISEGCASNFYKLKGYKDRGFKTFDHYYGASIAHRNQSVLSEHNLAPYVYSEVGRVRIGNSKQLSRWGFITEMAETIGCGGNECTCDECDFDQLEDTYRYQIDDLVDEMDELGFYFADSHIGNIGHVYRNSQRILVCIDTGDESVTSNECHCISCLKGVSCHV